MGSANRIDRRELITAGQSSHRATIREQKERFPFALPLSPVGSRDRISSMHYHPDMGAVVLIPIKLFGSDTNLAVGRSPYDHHDSRLSISCSTLPSIHRTLPSSFIRSYRTKSKRLNPTYKWTPRRLLSSRLPTPRRFLHRPTSANPRIDLPSRELDHPLRSSSL